MANKLTLNLLKPQDFFNAYYWQSAVKNEDEFAVIVAEYLQNLEKSKHQSEKAICANVLKPFFERLNFNNVNSEYVLQGVATNSAIDLALIKDETATVIIEAKKQDNKEMITRDNANKKALHEAILYYFRERENGNLSLRFIIISNFYDFYIFRANEIEHIFYKNKKLAELYRKVVIEKDTLFTGTTKEFYEEAEKIINSDDFINGLISKRRYKEVIDYQGEITSNNQSDFLDKDGKLITAQINCFHLNLAEFKAKSRKAKESIKLFSREFLYGEFSYDPNKISKKFYEELLYILGLKEEKSGNLTPNNIAGSLFQNIESSLQHSDFDSKMQLIILWLNRLLFLKLIETNLINFNANGDKAQDASLKFLNSNKISDFDTLNTVFFDILAKPIGERQKSKFDYLPYLNSNIFQKQEIEKDKLSINQLHNEEYIEFYPQTTLLDENRKKRTGKIKFLDYLFQFLDAFDFGEIKTDEVSGSLKTHSDLISSAVLGQVFEKLNGYKDGSFYTPSFITEYMSKQSIDNLVLQRFSQKLDGYFDNIADLAEEIQLQIRRSADKQAKLNEFNAEIDHLKICDPAVGSGYFLVSVLNYLIALKSQLGILTDENGRRLNANIAYEFDELVIKNTDDSRFHYTRPKTESEPQHIIQKTLFKQKAHIIENCLFGVDINPNSCEIARLRLWIELLKSAYFTDFEEQNPLKQNALETLPNIDINIKCGNSLVSYFAVNEDIKISDKKAVEQLKEAVKAYKTGNDNKEILLKQIKGLQEKFRSTAFRSNNKIKQLQKQCAIYSQKYSDYLAEDNDKLRPYIHKQFFVEDFNEEDAQKDFNQLLKLHDEIFNLDQFNPFEWRFEFPEVLDENGNFTGFDLMIANPPYIRQEDIKHYKPIFSEKYQVFNSTADIYTYFFELSLSLIRDGGYLSFITSNKFCRANYGKNLRKFILDNSQIKHIIDLNGLKVFDSATVDTQITVLHKVKPQPEHNTFLFTHPESRDFSQANSVAISQTQLNATAFTFLSAEENSLKAKIEQIGTPLKEWDIQINYGIKTGLNDAFIIDETTRQKILSGCLNEDEKQRTDAIIKPILRGRDIKRYAYEWAGLYLINFHNGYKTSVILNDNEKSLSNIQDSSLATQVQNDETVSGSLKEIEIFPLDINDYPALKKWLDNFEPALSKRTDKGKTPYNLRNCAYLEEFEKEKIVYSEIVRSPQFYLDKGDTEQGHFYAEATSFLLTGEKLNYLYGMLNSEITAILFKKFYAGGGLGNEGYRYKKAFLENLPIPQITPDQEQIFVALVEEIIALKKQNTIDNQAKIADLEQQLNHKIYALYQLNTAEIQYLHTHTHTHTHQSHCWQLLVVIQTAKNYYACYWIIINKHYNKYSTTFQAA